jgi:dolichol-phosphate mannosyltransferase
MDAITSFSYKPLRLSFVLAAMGFVVTGLLAIIALASQSRSMEYGLFAAVALMGSLPLFCLGILGEYLGRVYDEVRQRPLSIVQDVYRTDQILNTQELSFRPELAERKNIRQEVSPAA